MTCPTCAGATRILPKPSVVDSITEVLECSRPLMTGQRDVLRDRGDQDLAFFCSSALRGIDVRYNARYHDDWIRCRAGPGSNRETDSPNISPIAKGVK